MTVLTVPAKFGLYPVSSDPSLLKRARRLRLAPAMVVKLPATRVLPLGSERRAETAPFGFGWKAVLTVPSSLMRARLRLATPPMFAKLPPSNITPVGRTVLSAPPTIRLPSARRARTSTEPLASGLKVVSSAPEKSTRARRFRAVASMAPLGWRAVNVPPKTTAPLDSTATALTGPLVLGSKFESTVPSAFRRAM